MNVGSLFAGIGGIDLGLERAGMTVAWQCEKDDYCKQILTSIGLTRQYLTMSEPSTVARDATLSILSRPTSSQADSRAKTSASPERGAGSTASDRDCGGSSHGSFAWFDRDTSSWKTYQRSFIGDSKLSSDGLPRTGMMRSGRLYPQRRWVPRTLESDCSWWPTPAAWDATDREIPDDAYVTETGTVRAQYGDDHSSNLGLQGTVKGREMMPTPRPCNGKKSSGMNRTEMYRAMERWPTPQESDATRGPDYARSSRKESGGDDCTTAVCKKEEKSGSLNPPWVAWLMGFPTEWTDLDPSETP